MERHVLISSYSFFPGIENLFPRNVKRSTQLLSILLSAQPSFNYDDFRRLMKLSYLTPSKNAFKSLLVRVYCDEREVKSKKSSNSSACIERCRQRDRRTVIRLTVFGLLRNSYFYRSLPPSSQAVRVLR